MIIHTALCDKCGAKAPAKKEMLGGTSYPDGWGTINENRELFIGKDLASRISIALCHECLLEVVNFIEK